DHQRDDDLVAATWIAQGADSSRPAAALVRQGSGDRFLSRSGQPAGGKRDVGAKAPLRGSVFPRRTSALQEAAAASQRGPLSRPGLGDAQRSVGGSPRQ